LCTRFYSPKQTDLVVMLSLLRAWPRCPHFLSAVATTRHRSAGRLADIGVATLGQVNENAINYSGILPNVQVLQDSAIGTGVVNTAPEVDGLVRRVPMVVRVGESLYPALGLDVLRGLAGDPSYQVRGSETGIEAVRVPSFDTINTDAAGRVWIDWGTTFAQQPTEGTIIFVGVTAAGITPLVPTPRGLMFPMRFKPHCSRLYWPEPHLSDLTGL
jgi:hypothetical protein